MELSSDLKFLADLARSLVEVRALLSLRRGNTVLVQQAHEILGETLLDLERTVATARVLLERSSEFSSSVCDVDSAVGQDGGTIVTTNGRYTLFRCDDCAHEVFVPDSLFGGLTA